MAGKEGYSSHDKDSWLHSGQGDVSQAEKETSKELLGFGSSVVLIEADGESDFSKTLSCEDACDTYGKSGADALFYSLRETSAVILRHVVDYPVHTTCP